MTTQKQKIAEFVEMCKGMNCAGAVSDVFHGEASGAYHITVDADSEYQDHMIVLSCAKECFKTFALWRGDALLSKQEVAA